MSGAKIIEGLKEAIAGDLSRVTIDGQVWVRATDLHADQQELMRINNALRVTLLSARQFINDLALDGTGEPSHAMLAEIDAVVR